MDHCEIPWADTTKNKDNELRHSHRVIYRSQYMESVISLVMIPSICLLRNSNSCWMYGMDPTWIALYICMNLFIFFHGHLIFVFESLRPNSQLFYPFYYRPGLIDTPCSMLFSMLVMKNVVYFMKNVVNFVNYFRQFCFYFSDDISSHRILLHCESIFETSILISILHSILLYILYIFCTFVFIFSCTYIYVVY